MLMMVLLEWHKLGAKPVAAGQAMIPRPTMMMVVNSKSEMSNLFSVSALLFDTRQDLSDTTTTN